MRSQPPPFRARLAAAVLARSPDWSAMAASMAMGRAARMRLPRSVTRAAVAVYSRYFGVALDEVDPAALERGYRSFDEFFTRRLRTGARTIEGGAGALTSPCDGALRDIAPIESGTRIAAKGHQFTVGELLADEELAQRFAGGLQATIYLHPRDYHRVHAPCDARAASVGVVPGRLLPVTDAALAREPRLFALNERMIHVLESESGPVAVVMVAAFGVGHMSCAYQSVVPHPDRIVREPVEPEVLLERGDELGTFHLGSTVVLLVGPGYAADERAKPGPIRLGKPLLRSLEEADA